MLSVLVCTYNSDWDKTRRTLYSVLMQKNVEFEIVVTDDGSTENNFEKIKEYFIQNNFSNYTLVSNSENQGTVRNVLSGLERVKGKYVKPISPGDFLYDENVLKRTYDFILHNYGVAVYFGTAVFYSNENGFLRLYRNKSNPVDLRPYLANDIKKIKYNYLCNRDYILGASFLYDKEKWAYYLKELMNFIKYVEDNTTVTYMLENNERLQFIPFVNTGGGYVWYEYGTGISTCQSKKWKKILAEEYRAVFKFLYEKGLYTGERLDEFDRYHKNLIVRAVHLLKKDPLLFFIRFYHFLGFARKLKGYKYLKPDIKLLKKILES